MKKSSLRSRAVVAAFAVALFIGIVSPVAASAAPVDVYRFYNARTGAHFYTISADEKAVIQRDFPMSLTYEGVSCTMDGASPAATQNLYRFYNINSGVHFYTASDAERDELIAVYSSTYRYEDVAYKVSPGKVDGAVPVYRFYNHRAGGIHFYTASAEERDVVIAQDGSTYSYEGIAYYVPIAPAAPVTEEPVPPTAAPTAPAPADEAALADSILDGLRAQYPRYLDGASVVFGDAHGYQALTYFTTGRIVVSPTHTADLTRILSHEIWHVIDWRDNGRIDWGEAVPPADQSPYRE